MHESMDIETVRAEALRKVGRNVVNFAKIEAAFKCLLSLHQLEGTETTIVEQLRKNQTRLHKKTLGMLVQEFSKNILVDASQSEPTQDLAEGEEMSFSVRITCSDPNLVKVQRRALARIVKERNQLIHQDLAFLDTSSVEDYCNLITLLDEQNPRLLNQLGNLRRMVEAIRNMSEALDELSKSPDFPNNIQSNQSNI